MSRLNQRLTRFVFLISIFVLVPDVKSQELNAGYPVLEEYLRRAQLLDAFNPAYSFSQRPFNLSKKPQTKTDSIVSNFFPKIYNTKHIHFGILPAINSTEINSKRPYGWGNKGMVPNVGAQFYTSAGFYAKFFILKIQFQPEFVYASNRPFEGFPDDYSNRVTRARFFYWNNGDNPERFGNDPISRLWWGQSSVAIEAGPIDLALSTANIWWGPGKFNSLTFSDNAEGFPHISLKSNRPIKTFLGDFEGELLVGRLENSLLAPSQSDSLNRLLFRRFDGDWRYLNALHISYSPSFLKGFFIGFSRTFQQYSKFKGNTFEDWFPIFQVFQKKPFFANGNSVIYDSNGQDQQVAISFRYFSERGKFEVYSEFGRRDHAYDWRDFTMSPEHARAYLLGFQKLVPLPEIGKYLQIRGEITHQQESVNRYIRYPGLIGNQTWHTHGLARGFVNRGQTLGVGHGVGSNVQTLEISLVEGVNKKGLIFERLENHQDFYYRAFGNNSSSGVDPWVDFSLGLLWDHQMGNLIVSTRSQVTHAMNYQWQTAPSISKEFNTGHNLWSFFGQVNLIYHFGK